MTGLLRGRVIVTLAVLMLIAGCSGTKEAAKGSRDLSLEQVLSRVQQRYGQIKTLRGGGSITIESRQASQSGSFDIDLKKPDSVLVDLHGPLGIHVGTLSLARDKFIFYNRMQNNAVIGKPDGKTLQGMLHLSMEFDELLNTFTGEFPLAGGAALDSFTIRDGQYFVLYRDGDVRKEYRIDGDTFIVTSYRILDDTGKATMVASASRPMETGSVEMPQLVRVVFPGERRSVTIAYDDITLNGTVDCSFALPDKVERIVR